VLTKPPYYDLEVLVALIDEPNRSACRQFLADHGPLCRQAPGSSYNHQAWTGGYWDHITETMNLWVLLYNAHASTGRLSQLPPEEQFSCSDGLTVLFWHDIEKPWRCELQDGKVIVTDTGELKVTPRLGDKASRKRFAEEKIQAYGLQLTPAIQNGLAYVEGIRDADYSPRDRVMKPLAALCHSCDLQSARMYYAFPLVENDAWGARRAAS